MTVSPCVSEYSVADTIIDTTNTEVVIPFYKDCVPLDSIASPKAILTLQQAGSMRFRWNEINENRNLYLKKLKKTIVPLELIHSKTVYIAERNTNEPNTVMFETSQGNSFVSIDIQGDGIITTDSSLVPIITVADCMPIWLFDPITKFFGVCHSGWKGTGIVVKAIELAKSKYKSQPKDILVILGPHIHSCCYKVDKIRADFFKNCFSPECSSFIKNKGIDEYTVSLANANILSLIKAGISEKNIVHCIDCTCCTKSVDITQHYFFGSFRRQLAGYPQDLSLEEKSHYFTPMAAYIVNNLDI